MSSLAVALHPLQDPAEFESLIRRIQSIGKPRAGEQIKSNGPRARGWWDWGCRGEHSTLSPLVSGCISAQPSVWHPLHSGTVETIALGNPECFIHPYPAASLTASLLIPQQS